MDLKHKEKEEKIAREQGLDSQQPEKNRRVRHYREIWWMVLGNMAVELLLLLVVFVLAGYLRAWIPLGSDFFTFDIWKYLPLGVLYALSLVLCYEVQGKYNTIHILNGVKREILEIALTNLVGMGVAALALFSFQLSQFSRLYLVYYYIFSVLALEAKRVLFWEFARRYSLSHGGAARILMMGGGDLAERYYRNVIVGADPARISYVGYLAASENEQIPGYLGKPQSLLHILKNERVDMLMLTMDRQELGAIRKLVLIADSCGIRVGVVPVYEDFMSSLNQSTYQNGVWTKELMLMDSCQIMGVNIVVTDMEKTVEMIRDKLHEWSGKYICVANVHTTVTASKDKEYLSVQNGAVMALPDGGPLSKYSRDVGHQEARRVTGPDLMQEILRCSGQYGWRHYFYGSTQETLDKMQKVLRERYPGAVIAGMYSPPFRDLTPEEDEEIVEKINETKPDFVWVGLGAPKQERWMAAHEDRVKGLMIGVGAAFDYEAGNIRRAPMWMQKRNLEWLYRLMQDPKRLFTRYLSTNTRYLLWTWRNR